MEIKSEHPNAVSLESEDVNGAYEIQVIGFNDKSGIFQILIDCNEYDSAYVNLNLEELIGFRDILNDAIKTLIKPQV